MPSVSVYPRRLVITNCFIQMEFVNRVRHTLPEAFPDTPGMPDCRRLWACRNVGHCVPPPLCVPCGFRPRQGHPLCNRVFAAPRIIGYLRNAENSGNLSRRQIRQCQDSNFPEHPWRANIPHFRRRRKSGCQDLLQSGSSTASHHRIRRPLDDSRHLLTSPA